MNLAKTVQIETMCVPNPVGADLPRRQRRIAFARGSSDLLPLGSGPCGALTPDLALAHVPRVLNGCREGRFPKEKHERKTCKR